MRVGRGIGSGKGKTARPRRQGPDGAHRRGASTASRAARCRSHRRLPKRGFNNIFRQRLSRWSISAACSRRSTPASSTPAAPIDGAALVAAGVLRRARDGVRLLAKGELTATLTIEVAGASKAAIAAVEKAGGTVVVSRAGAPRRPAAARRQGVSRQRSPAR